MNLKSKEIGLGKLELDVIFEEYEAMTQELWAATEHAREETDGLAGSDSSTIHSL